MADDFQLWRTTAYCSDHGIRRIVSVEPIPQRARPRDSRHLVGVLLCGCRFSIVTSHENADRIRAGIRFRPVIHGED